MPFAELGGQRVYYEEHGEGEPLLLLGDLGLDHTAWAPQIELLSRHHRVIVFDNPGSGRTEGSPGPYTTELFADVAAGLIDRVAGGSAHVVGASMGGAVGQQLALRHPGLVRSLALHGTWGQTDNHLRAFFRSWQTAARALPLIDLHRQIWLCVFTVWHYNDRPEAIAELERRVLEAPPQSPDHFCAQVEACIAHDALDRLGEIAAPVLITVGDRDALTPPHHAYAIKERVPQARVRVWQKMGHAPYWETPEDFSAVTLDFVTEH
jgi:pimeloyl-ACP methyl ester carboxylesterase